MKILDLPEVTSVNNDQVMIVDGGGLPTSKIKVSNLNVGSSGEGGGNIIANPEDQWVYHRNTYRGKNLGAIYTEEQKAAVANNIFDDLYIGDYWQIGNFDWIIADINYWLGRGNSPCITPHLVIIPRTILYNHVMNDTAVSTGGYTGSKMYTQGLNNAKTMIYTAFGENNILDHNETLPNAFENNVITGNININSKIDLMNQSMVYGSMIKYNGNATIDPDQLSIFNLNPNLIFIENKVYWLRDPTASTRFACCSFDGYVESAANQTNFGVRPAFGLIG